MKKRMSLILLFAMLIMSISTVYGDSISIYLNGTEIESDVKPVLVWGNTFIPLRPVAEAMGCSVEWNPETKRIDIGNANTIIYMQIDNKYMRVRKTVTGKKEDSKEEIVTLAYEPRIINGSTYIPMRPMVEALGGKLSWDAATKTINITTEEEIKGGIFPNFDETTGTLTISGSGPMKDYSIIRRPSWKDYNIKKVIIEDGITSIGDYAFAGAWELESVEMADSVKSIGENAFEICTNLKSVKLSSSLESIGSDAFDLCESLGNVDFPSSLKKIGDFSFDGCYGFTSLDIPNSVTEIGERAFHGCENVTSLKISSSLTQINTSAFGFLNITEVEIPSSVKSIDEDAFEDCFELVSVTIPDSIEEIDDNAFRSCNSLKNINCSDTTKAKFKALQRS